MNPIRFTKMHGGGNDFILLDNRDHRIPPGAHQLIRKLCTRHSGVGADGLMLLEESSQADFRLFYFNADGYPAEMCGNGARCAVWLAYRLHMAPRHCRFEIQQQFYEAEILSEFMVKLKMPPPQILTQPDGLTELLNNKFPEMLWLNTGVPHLVVRVNEPPETIDVAVEGETLRHHPVFQPDGTNVNFVYPKEKDYLRARVYERGVEKETLACGTGAVACGIYAALQLGAYSPVKVEYPGGILHVEFKADFSEVFLNGPVTPVYEGTLSREFMISIL